MNKIETPLILIDKAIELHIARDRKKKGEKFEADKAINRQRLGMVLYPGSKYNTVRISMHDMVTGKMKKVTVKWVGIICGELGVDSNFLFGLPSIHDEEYNSLCGSDN